MDEEISIGLGNENCVQSKIEVGDRTVNFYKLDKSKNYRVEGAGGGVAMIIFIIFTAIIDLTAIVLCIVFMDTLFKSAEGTVVPVTFVAFGAIFTAVTVFVCNKTRNDRRRVKAILSDCTLTDGQVVESYVEKRVSRNGDSTTTYYDVDMTYSFFDLDGSARHGRLIFTYTIDPEFYEGQNLMVAFNSEDSVILSKFSLSEGAKEFAQAEAERLELDFSDLSGKLIDIATDKPIKTRAYSRGYAVAGASMLGFWLFAALFFVIISIVFEWGAYVLLPIALTWLFMGLPATCIMISGLKRVVKFKRILKNPSFTKGVVFFRKTTFSGSAKKVFYRFKDADGGCHVEKFAGSSLLPLKDGERVIVAYSGGNSEIVQEYTEKRKSGRRRAR